MQKKSLNERIKKAQEELQKTVIEERDILDLISKCLSEQKIDADVYVEPAPRHINYKDIMDTYGTNGEGHVIWVEFVKSGHVAVVGAGKDIGFPRNEKKGTWCILSKLLNVDWDVTKVIIVPVRGLNQESYGIKNVDNLLKCRNGIEHYIGEYLINSGVPVLNFYQHKNYSERYWNACKKRNYNI